MKTEPRDKLIIGITIGDINGIGIEVIVKTLLDERLLQYFTPVIYGSAKMLTFHINALEISGFSFKTIKDLKNLNLQSINVFNCWNEDVPVEFGIPTNASGEYAYKALEYAVNDLESGKLDALVTAPINKKGMQDTAFNFPGHTEYLMEKFRADDCLMFMIADNLKVGIVTGHIPLKNVPSLITKERVFSKIDIINYSLIKDFGITRPKIALLGLNPHAGEGGIFGKEEQTAIIPAIEKARKNEILVLNPFSADTFFGSGHFTKFDGILSMYHDQGLLPFKTIQFGKGVNYTAGLSVVRTSPDHGTAYDIAGKNRADESSFREAVFKAIDIVNKRKEYRELAENSSNSVENLQT